MRSAPADTAAATRAFVAAESERTRVRLREMSGAPTQSAARLAALPAIVLADEAGALWRVTVNTNGVLGAVKA